MAVVGRETKEVAFSDDLKLLNQEVGRLASLEELLIKNAIIHPIEQANSSADPTLQTQFVTELRKLKNSYVSDWETASNTTTLRSLLDGLMGGRGKANTLPIVKKHIALYFDLCARNRSLTKQFSRLAKKSDVTKVKKAQEDLKSQNNKLYEYLNTYVTQPKHSGPKKQTSDMIAATIPNYTQIQKLLLDATLYGPEPREEFLARLCHEEVGFLKTLRTIPTITEDISSLLAAREKETPSEIDELKLPEFKRITALISKLECKSPADVQNRKKYLILIYSVEVMEELRKTIKTRAGEHIALPELASPIDYPGEDQIELYRKWLVHVKNYLVNHPELLKPITPGDTRSRASSFDPAEVKKSPAPGGLSSTSSFDHSQVQAPSPSDAPSARATEAPAPITDDSVSGSTPPKGESSPGSRRGSMASAPPSLHSSASTTPARSRVGSVVVDATPIGVPVVSGVLDTQGLASSRPIKRRSRVVSIAAPTPPTTPGMQGSSTPSGHSPQVGTETLPREEKHPAIPDHKRSGTRMSDPSKLVSGDTTPLPFRHSVDDKRRAERAERRRRKSAGLSASIPEHAGQARSVSPTPTRSQAGDAPPPRSIHISTRSERGDSGTPAESAVRSGQLRLQTVKLKIDTDLMDLARELHKTLSPSLQVPGGAYKDTTVAIDFKDNKNPSIELITALCNSIVGEEKLTDAQKTINSTILKLSELRRLLQDPTLTEIPPLNPFISPFDEDSAGSKVINLRRLRELNEWLTESLQTITNAMPSPSQPVESSSSTLGVAAATVGVCGTSAVTGVGSFAVGGLLTVSNPIGWVVGGAVGTVGLGAYLFTKATRHMTPPSDGKVAAAAIGTAVAGGGVATTATILGGVGIFAGANIWNPIGWSIVLGACAVGFIAGASYLASKAYIRLTRGKSQSAKASSAAAASASSVIPPDRAGSDESTSRGPQLRQSSTSSLLAAPTQRSQPIPVPGASSRTPLLAGSPPTKYSSPSDQSDSARAALATPSSGRAVLPSGSSEERGARISFSVTPVGSPSVGSRAAPTGRRGRAGSKSEDEASISPSSDSSSDDEVPTRRHRGGRRY